MEFVDFLFINNLLCHMQCPHKIGWDVNVIMKCALVSYQYRW